jgi:hypothetical protein
MSIRKEKLCEECEAIRQLRQRVLIPRLLGSLLGQSATVTENTPETPSGSNGSYTGHDDKESHQ